MDLSTHLQIVHHGLINQTTALSTTHHQPRRMDARLILRIDAEGKPPDGYNAQLKTLCFQLDTASIDCMYPSKT